MPKPKPSKPASGAGKPKDNSRSKVGSASLVKRYSGTGIPPGVGTPAKKLRVTPATGKNKARLDAANKNDGTKSA